jgi:hypothetical protein
MNIIDFIHVEVERQGFSGDEHVERSQYMLTAWKQAQENLSHDMPISIVTLMTWGHLVEPDVNPRISFRGLDVIAGGRRCPPAADVPILMEFFITSILPSSTTPDEKYHIFELIHPFVDGNGRVGKIVYNYLMGTLHDPEFPTNFFEGDVA